MSTPMCNGLFPMPGSYKPWPASGSTVLANSAAAPTAATR